MFYGKIDYRLQNIYPQTNWKSNGKMHIVKCVQLFVIIILNIKLILTFFAFP